MRRIPAQHNTILPSVDEAILLLSILTSHLKADGNIVRSLDRCSAEIRRGRAMLFISGMTSSLRAGFSWTDSVTRSIPRGHPLTKLADLPENGNIAAFCQGILIQLKRIREFRRRISASLSYPLSVIVLINAVYLLMRLVLSPASVGTAGTLMTGTSLFSGGIQLILFMDFAALSGVTLLIRSFASVLRTLFSPGIRAGKQQYRRTTANSCSGRRGLYGLFFWENFISELIHAGNGGEHISQYIWRASTGSPLGSPPRLLWQELVKIPADGMQAAHIRRAGRTGYASGVRSTRRQIFGGEYFLHSDRGRILVSILRSGGDQSDLLRVRDELRTVIDKRLQKRSQSISMLFLVLSGAATLSLGLDLLLPMQQQILELLP